MIVAIDGPAGSGKSTISSLVAERTGFVYLNSGRIYRAITWWVIDRDIQSGRAVEDAIGQLSITVSSDSVTIDGDTLSAELHSDAVDAKVAEISSLPLVRQKVNSVILSEARGKNVVVEGRDMTTVVFPDAEVKWYLDASPESRARRRHKQGTSKLDYERVLNSIILRDKIDMEKKVGGLKVATDALYLDTSDLTIESVCDKVIQSIQGIITSQE